jgi:hypothetical protein
MEGTARRSGRESREACVLKTVSRSRLLGILRVDPGTPVRVWSVQHRDALRVARRIGWLSGNHGHAFGRYCDAMDQTDDPSPLNPYDWMRQRMAERMPGFSGDYPVWAWLKRPSTRPSVWRRAAGEATVLVSASVPRHRLLLSAFDDWHAVLNNGYLSRTEAEDATVEAAGAPTTAQRRASWTRIFEVGRSRSAEEVQWRGAGLFVQACIDRIHLSEMVRVVEPTHRRRDSGRTTRSEMVSAQAC